MVDTKKKSRTMLDFLEAAAAAASRKITLDEFTTIRRHGTPDEIAEAVERMNAAGGYDNLE